MSAHLARLLSLEGRVALIVGGAGGIGSAIVSLFVEADARVASADRPDQPDVPGVVSLACDVSRAAEVAALVEAVVRQFGRLDVVVHAAGITRDRTILKMTDADWSEVLAANLDSAFYLLRACGVALRQAGGGAVVLISSINGERGKAGQANYAASKAGLNALARTGARELGRYGIRVNAIAPGWIETRMTSALPDEVRLRATAETAIGHLGRPEDVARAALFLCADAGRHITGQVIRVDGGQLIG